jgi:hypothetical protein
MCSGHEAAHRLARQPGTVHQPQAVYGPELVAGPVVCTGYQLVATSRGHQKTRAKPAAAC